MIEAKLKRDEEIRKESYFVQALEEE